MQPCLLPIFGLLTIDNLSPRMATTSAPSQARDTHKSGSNSMEFHEGDLYSFLRNSLPTSFSTSSTAKSSHRKERSFAKL